MLYKELKEMTPMEWDGEPFKAYVEDNEDNSIGHPFVLDVVGYCVGCFPWLCENVRYKHAYPVKWNEEKVKGALKPKRMTYRQLSWWLAKGNGEWLDKFSGAASAICYDQAKGNYDVEPNIKVRKWGSDEWIEPTPDLLEEN